MKQPVVCVAMRADRVAIDAPRAVDGVVVALKVAVMRGHRVEVAHRPEVSAVVLAPGPGILYSRSRFVH
jgi:hypothetical protein